jgi:ankyrin repeat protein
MIETSIIEQGRLLRKHIIEDEIEEAIQIMNEIGVNTPVDASVTPFVMACIHHKLDLVRNCLENGGNPNALYYPNRCNNISVLAFSCERGYVNQVELLLKQQANPNYINGEGKSVLQFLLAAPSNRKEILKLLLQYGADINVPMTFNDNQPFLEVITDWKLEDFLQVIHYQRN